jgi:hypothetical protein
MFYSKKHEDDKQRLAVAPQDMHLSLNSHINKKLNMVLKVVTAISNTGNTWETQNNGNISKSSNRSTGVSLVMLLSK